jgi:hypothetical protein
VLVTLPRRSNLAEELTEQHVEMMNAVLALDRIASAIIGGGAQAALHIFAKADVFLLNFVAEGDGSLDTFAVFSEATSWKNHSKMVSVLSCESGTMRASARIRFVP